MCSSHLAVFTNKQMNKHMHKYINKYIHIYIYIYTHTHTRTYANSENATKFYPRAGKRKFPEVQKPTVLRAVPNNLGVATYCVEGFGHKCTV